MQKTFSLKAWPKEFMAAVAVAAVVSVAFTVAASLFDRFHQVSAEDLRTAETSAVAIGNKSQVLSFNDWGVSLTVPLGADMPQVWYTAQGSDSFGLSTTYVEKKSGAACSAGHNAVGVIVRSAAGSPLSSTESQIATSLGTIGGYTYTYETPDSTCAATDAAEAANHEAMVIEGNGELNSL